ncbi:hypothetical protein B7494_g1332 [Chlorociboria aeruginascens]|nr:hypothetical protein B7494_g1332 [Chlorociboria aeruginascens]
MQNANITISRPEPGLEAHTKCDTCQQDRQKCFPPTRSWPGRKCDRCIEKDLECSEPQPGRKLLRKDGLSVEEGAAQTSDGPSESSDSENDAIVVINKPQMSVESNRPTHLSQWYSDNDGPWTPKLVPGMVAKPSQHILRPYNARVEESWRQGGPSSDSGYVCQKALKTQSELRKHILRHNKPFICKISGCSRTEGFGTTNDLERHIKSKHALTPLPEKRFRCLVPGCKSKDKSWPRLDNFRSHLKRVHPSQLGTDKDFENLIRKAEFWTDHQDNENLGPAISNPQIQSALPYSEIQGLTQGYPTPENPAASSPQIQSTLQRPRMQGLRHGYLSPGNGSYLADESSPQSFQQISSTPQPGAQGWALQKPPEFGNDQPTSIPFAEREVTNTLEQEYVPRRALRTGIAGNISTAGWTLGLSNLDKTNQILRHNEYKYRPIGDHEIRLLLLQPGHQNDIIQCSLVSMSLLDQRTPYEALSYYRGVDKPLFEIRILSLKLKNEKRSLRDFVREKYFVSSTLHLALRYLRDAKRPIYLWVDELCINKEDPQEHFSNILKRPSIFSQASNVCVWLGENDSSSNQTVEFIPQILNLSLLDNLVEDSSRISAWLAFIETMARPWFSRLLSVQEMAFSTNATVHFGSDVVHWADFADAVALFHFKTDNIKQLLMKSPYPSDKKHIFKARTYFATTVVDASRDLVRYSYGIESRERTYTLGEILPKFTRFKITDPRDIFALVSLAKDIPLDIYTISCPIPPIISPIFHYQKDMSKVYIDVAMYSMSSSKSLDLICRRWTPLSNTLQGQEAVPKPVLPSWIPSSPDSRLSNVSNDNAFGFIESYAFVGPPTQKVYNTSGSASPRISLDRQSSSLSVLGFRLGTIDRHLPRTADGIVWKDTFQMAGLRQYSLDLSTVPEMLWRTLVADRDPNGSSPPSWYHRACLYSLAHASTIDNGDLDTSLLLRSPGSSSEREFLERVQTVTWNRKFFTMTPKGRFGIGPAKMEEKDLVCVLYGCSVPVVLRDVASPDGARNFKVIGECFVYGMMEGEALSERILFRAERFKDPILSIGSFSNEEFRVANACQSPDLFWALKEGGGGTFGLVMEVGYRDDPAMLLSVAYIQYNQIAGNIGAWLETRLALLVFAKRIVEIDSATTRNRIDQITNILTPTPSTDTKFQDAIMSEGEIEVEAISGYSVLPKDVIQEIGSVKLFNKWAYDDVEIRDISLTDYIQIRSPVYISHSAGRYAQKRFRKAQCPIIERLTNSLMMNGRNNGKKLMAVRIVAHSFEIIHIMTDQNPIQIAVDAIVNCGPREDSTRIGSAGTVRRQAVDVSPLRRVNQAIALLTIGAREAAFRNVKSVAECLAEELINAAKGSSNSYAIKKKDELERVAKSNR